MSPLACNGSEARIRLRVNGRFGNLLLPASPGNRAEGPRERIGKISSGQEVLIEVMEAINQQRTTQDKRLQLSA